MGAPNFYLGRDGQAYAPCRDGGFYEQPFHHRWRTPALNRRDRLGEARGGTYRFWLATFARRGLSEGFEPGQFDQRSWISESGRRWNILVRKN